MLTILKHQMEALRQNALEMYEDRLVARLQQNHPEAVAGMRDGALRERIRGEIAGAREQGITAEHDVTRRVEQSIAADSGPVQGEGLQAGAEPAPLGSAPTGPEVPQEAEAPQQKKRAASGAQPRQVGDPVQPCLGWIEIVLTDEDGAPIPDERYTITLPDGTKREGALDGEGRAYLVGLDPGTCQVSFPDIEVEKA